MDNIQRMHDRLKQINSERDLLKIEVEELDGTLSQLNENSAEWCHYKVLQEEKKQELRLLLDETMQLFEDIKQQCALQATYMQRPYAGVVALVSPLLGRQPEVRSIKWSEKELQEIKTPNAYAAVTVAMVACIAFALYYFVPWMRTSPLKLIFAIATEDQMDSLLVGNISFVIVLAFMIYTFLYKKREVSKFLGDQAVLEEEYFRAGAETWPVWRRVTSCLAFGLCHVVNIVLPLSAMFALCFAGAMFMRAYLHDYALTKSSRHATMVAARVHQRYNIYALCLLLAVVMLYLVLTIVAIGYAFM